MSEPKRRGRPPGPRKASKLISMRIALDVLESLDRMVSSGYAKNRTAAVERLFREKDGMGGA